MNPEKILIARLLTAPKQHATSVGRLSPDYFETLRNRQIFEAISDLLREGETPNLVAINKHLKKEGNGLSVDEMTALSETPISLNIPTAQLVEQILDDYTRREIKEAAGMLAYGTAREEDVLSHIEELRRLRHTEEGKGIKELAKDAIEALEMRMEAVQSGQPIPGKMYSGIEELDKYSTMWQGVTVAIGGRPAMGKSSFLRTLAYNLAKSGQPVLIFSLEMSPDQVTEGFLSLISQVNGLAMREGDITLAQKNSVINAAAELTRLPITIKGINELDTLLSDIQEWAKTRNGKGGAVFVDYAQQLSDSSRKYGTNDLQMKAISKALMLYAKRYRYCSLPLLQLSRAVETRGGDKRPFPSDLRESGSFEQDANAIIMLYRPEVYGFETNEEGDSTKGICELLIRKNRTGPTGVVITRFYPAYGLFCDVNAQPFGQPSTDNQISIPPIRREEEVPF